MQKHFSDQVFRTPFSRWAGRLSFNIRSVVSSKAFLKHVHYQVFVRWTELKNHRKGLPVGGAVRVGNETEIVIDGFQGSANSFATSAFKSAQTRHVHLCHHLHAPVQVIEAVRMDKPVILTIRNPRRAILSLVSRWEYLTVEQGLKGYIRYYKALLPYADKMIVSSFNQTTEDFGSVIARTNEKWGTSFVEFSGDVDDVLLIRDMSDRKKQEKVLRSEVKESKLHEFENANVRALLAVAESIFQGLTIHS